MMALSDLDLKSHHCSFVRPDPLWRASGYKATAWSYFMHTV